MKKIIVIEDYQILSIDGSEASGNFKLISPDPVNGLCFLSDKEIVPICNNDCNHIFIKTNDFYRKVYYSDIAWIEAAGSYSYMNLKESKRLCVSFSLSELMLYLPDSIFVRTHRSFLVNVSHIDSFVGNMLCIGTDRIPISRLYKSDILKCFNILGKNFL